MELDEEFRTKLGYAALDADEHRGSLARAVGELSVHRRRKPGSAKPRATMLPIVTATGDTEELAVLTRCHYKLRVGDPEGRNPRSARLVRLMGAAIDRRLGRIVDRAPMKDIRATPKSEYTLPEHQRAARALIELLTPIADGLPPGEQEQRALRAGLKAFALTPHDAWAITVVREIERSRRGLNRIPQGQQRPDDVTREVHAILTRARTELGGELPEWIDYKVIECVLIRYGFHSKGGAAAGILGRTAAIQLLLDPQAVSHLLCVA
jgi:hypothetical protein